MALQKRSVCRGTFVHPFFSVLVQYALSHYPP
nr:MAG TPA: hypothetical protein [Caudoviricetes sp.]